jgi:tagatose 1,6-diphosphate aldolase
MKITGPGVVPRRGLFGHPIRIGIAGGIGLRIGHNEEIERFYGHIGYHVYPPSRGRHYAERACRLLLALVRHHGIHPLWITTNPENHASRRTCERLGGKLADVVDVPPGHPLYLRGERRKCRYRIEC